MKPVTYEELSAYMTGDKEPWLSNRWRVTQLPKIGTITPSELMVESIDLPMVQFDVRTKHYGARSMHVVGGSQIDGFTMSMYVDDQWRSVKYINDWFATMQNPNTGGFYLPGYYMKTIGVELYDTKGDVILRSKIDNVFPISMSEPSLSANAEKLSISVQFKCYWQTLTWAKN